VGVRHRLQQFPGFRPAENVLLFAVSAKLGLAESDLRAAQMLWALAARSIS